MIITNRYGLPAPYVRAVSVQREAKPYTISVTQLIKPPQMLALELAHRDEIVKDSSDFIDMFFGTAIHHYLDHFSGPDAESEKVLTWEQDGWTVHGTPDHAEWLEKIGPRTLGCHLQDCIWPAQDHQPPFAGDIDLEKLVPLLPLNCLFVWEMSPRKTADQIRHSVTLWKERFGE